MKSTLQKQEVFFLIQYFVQSLVGIAYEPLDYILKDRLHLTTGQAAGFIAWMTLPLLLKPLSGFVTDFLPWGGYRRAPHIVAGAFLASFSFFWVATQSHYHYLTLLAPMLLSCLAMAYADVACGGLLVEEGKEQHRTASYQALQIAALYAGVILTGFGSGWMTTHLPYPWIFVIAGLFPLTIIAATFLIPQATPAFRPTKNVGVLWAFLRTRRCWALSLTLVLWNFYPFLGTVQFYYQSNVLGLTPQWIGSLMSIGSLAGLLGSVAFWKLCADQDARKWVVHGPVAMALITLLYFFYHGPISVTLVEAIYGFASVFFRVALLDVLARACPTDAEATVYAIFLTLLDVAMYSSNAIGGKLYDGLQNLFAVHPYHAQMSGAVLVLMGALCTLACRWTLPPLEENEFSRT